MDCYNITAGIERQLRVQSERGGVESGHLVLRIDPFHDVVQLHFHLRHDPADPGTDLSFVEVGGTKGLVLHHELSQLLGRVSDLVLSRIEDNPQDLNVFHHRYLLSLKSSSDLVVAPSVLRLTDQKPSGDGPQGLWHVVRHWQLALDLQLHQLWFLLAELTVPHPQGKDGHAERIVVRCRRHDRIGDIPDAGGVGVKLRSGVDHGSGLRSVDAAVIPENVRDPEVRDHGKT